MSRRRERALPLGVPNAPNKQFMMRQRAKFCKLISQRAESECARENALRGECDSTICEKSAVGVIPSAARELLFMQALSKKADSSGKIRPGNYNLRVFPQTIKPGSERDAGREARRRRARARGNYFRRNRLEISPESERNTSTANAPIMQKAIIIFSGSA
jgi:hypothetical protein